MTYKRPEGLGAECEHGHLARSCGMCDLIEALDELHEKLADMHRRAQDAEARAHSAEKRMETWATDTMKRLGSRSRMLRLEEIEKEHAALRDKARAWDAIAGGTLQLCATYVGGTLKYYAMGTSPTGERQYGSTFPLHADPLSAVLAAIDGKGATK